MHENARNPAGWLALFGPGAIIASLTIGAGELIFSTRGGALFGYRLLGLFLLICLLKWALVFATARHIVLSGAHPFQRWMHLPGPTGWLPMAFLLLAGLSFPVWVGFHAGTVGTLLAALTDTQAALRGASHFAWGLVVLAAVQLLVWTGSYRRLERLQLLIVAAMLACVSVSLILLRPDLGEMLQGLFSLAEIEYPPWIERHAELARRPLGVELATYVGVVGGSGYDYLAYVSFLRDKHWGAAGGSLVSPDELQQSAAAENHENRRWIRAPLVDSSLSFAIVFLFSAIFLTCGAEVLRPQEKLPGGSDLLTLQAEFVSGGTPRLRPIYFAGALLAMFGTLYGTLEVAPTIARELALAFGRPLDPRRMHRAVTAWVAFGGALVLVVSLVSFLASAAPQPPALIAILTPANLFTGVLACGIIAAVSLWSDRRWLPPRLRASVALQLLNAAGACLFVALGLKAYWDQGGVKALALLSGTLLAGAAVAWRARLQPSGGGVTARQESRPPA
jgi:Mn2+/Fe2+ NRAMP family transporter